MEPMKINQLLDKYFEAQTNTAEEAELKAYFSGQKSCGRTFALSTTVRAFCRAKENGSPRVETTTGR